jgi:N-acylglucosamine-6-phosphate 2-epimerase
VERSKQRAHIRQTLDLLQGGLVVSCQARAGNPLHGADSMVLMARAAELGGARALRANGPADVAAILAATSLPVMAINKVDYPDSAVGITPTVQDAAALTQAGATMVALDATRRMRPHGESMRDIVTHIHTHGGVAMGDLSSQDDLEGALAADIDAVGTTLSGYTGETVPDEPDLDLLAWLVKMSPVPVFAEGRYWTPEQATRALELGAAFVVVGTAITNPMAITSRFVQSIERARGSR